MNERTQTSERAGAEATAYRKPDVRIVDTESATISVEEAAREIRVSPDTLRGMVRRGEIPHAVVACGGQREKFIIPRKGWELFLIYGNAWKPETPAARDNGREIDRRLGLLHEAVERELDRRAAKTKPTCLGLELIGAMEYLKEVNRL